MESKKTIISYGAHRELDKIFCKDVCSIVLDYIKNDIDIREIISRYAEMLIRNKSFSSYHPSLTHIDNHEGTGCGDRWYRIRNVQFSGEASYLGITCTENKLNFFQKISKGRCSIKLAEFIIRLGYFDSMIHGTDNFCGKCLTFVLNRGKRFSKSCRCTSKIKYSAFDKIFTTNPKKYDMKKFKRF